VHRRKLETQRLKVNHKNIATLKIVVSQKYKGIHVNIVSHTIQESQ
jgi:hypothetical protein